MYDDYEGKKLVTDQPDEESDGESSSSSRSSTSSEELQPDLPQQAPPHEKVVKVVNEDVFFAGEIEVTWDDFVWLAKNNSRKKAYVGLSRKMNEKGKEIKWEALPLSKKKEFDLAQAKELSQVATSQACRNLTKQELKEFDLSTRCPALAMR